MKDKNKDIKIKMQLYIGYAFLFLKEQCESITDGDNKLSLDERGALRNT